MKKSLLLLLATMMLFACQMKSKGQAIAQVNKEILTESDARAMVGKTQWDQMSPDERREVVREWIDLTLLAQDADAKKLGRDLSTRKKIEMAIKKVKSNALIANQLAQIKVSEEELFNYYRIHMGELSQSGKEVKVQRILVQDKAKVDFVLNEIRNGMSFADAARAFSLEKQGQNGGYAGMASAADSVTTIWDALKNVKLYEITTAPAPDGFYILRYYEELVGAGNQSFESLKEEIRQRVLKEKQQQIFDDLLKQLKSKADITISI